MKKLYNTKEIPPSCSYCSYGRPSPDGESILCIKKGIAEKDGYCKKFRYDILKRQPRRPATLQKFDKDDFSL